MLEYEKNLAAGMKGCLGAIIAMGVGIYIALRLIPHVPQWLGLLAFGTAVIGPQIAAAYWHEKQKERNLLERMQSERERREQEELNE